MADDHETLRRSSPEAQQEFLGVRIPPLPPANLEPVEPPGEAPHYRQYSLPRLEERANFQLMMLGAKALIVVKPEKRLQDSIDFAVPAHRLMQSDGLEAVTSLAERLAMQLSDDTEVEQAGPFINLRQNRLMLAHYVFDEIAEQGDLYGYNNEGRGDTIVLDVSSPNIAKNMHLGHLRSTVIGEALSRILFANGYKTIRDNHLGDWGTQFGILSHAYELWSDEVPELQDEAQQVAGLQKLYIRINQAIAAEKAADDGGDSQLEEAGRQWFTRLEQGDPQARELWQWAWNLSMQEFEKVYEALGVNFEFILGESEYADMSSDVYDVMEARGIAQLDEKNRLKIIPSNSHLHPLTIRKSDGSSLYGTRDIAALCARMAWFDPEKIIYVVGSEQRDYFKQVFDGFTQLAGMDTPELKHVSFGPIELPEGKMSSRAGNVVFLNDVLEEAYSRAYEKVLSNAQQKGTDVTPAELELAAQQVAVGAVVYYDLKQSADRKITFSWDEVLNFEGNSGPYLQYAHARMTALLEEAEGVESDINIFKLDTEGLEGEIVAALAEFPMAVKEAGEKYAPVVVSEYLYRLAHKFNVFYAQTPILKEQDTEKRAARLLLTASVQQVLQNGLNLLNIPMPRQM